MGGGSRTTAETYMMPDETPADDRSKGPDTGSEKEPLRQLTLGQSRSSSGSQSSRPIVPASPQDDLDGLAARCRAKAEAARWAVERQRRLLERDERSHDDAAGNSEIRFWADELTDAFYWASAGEKSTICTNSYQPLRVYWSRNE